MSLKLNLGSGDHRIPGFTNVDLHDLSADVRAHICELPFDNESVDEVVAYQVIEHIEYWREKEIFQEMYRVLKPMGTAIIECPDMAYIAQKILSTGDIAEKWIWNIYGQYYRPWDVDRYDDYLDNEASKHRNAFTLKKIKRLCEPLGFYVKPNREKYSDYPECLSVTLVKYAPDYIDGDEL